MKFSVEDLTGFPIYKTDLKVGDKVKIMTLFGPSIMTVEQADGDFATAYASKTFASWMHVEEDGFWGSGCSFNPEAVIKVQLV